MYVFVKSGTSRIAKEEYYYRTLKICLLKGLDCENMIHDPKLQSFDYFVSSCRERLNKTKKIVSYWPILLT